jgi:hypothetical protein
MKPKFLVTVFFILTFTFWPLTVAQADPNGLKVDVYTFAEGALPEMQPYELCNSAVTSVADINFDVGGDVVAECQADFVLIHYSGYLTSPVSANVLFQSWADDGFYMSFDGVPVIENWWPKGCSGGSAVVPMIADVSVKFDAWWYEYGGGACNRLYWDAEGEFAVVPASAFSQDPIDPIIIVPIPEPTTPVVIPDPVTPIPEPTTPVVIPDPVVPDPVIPDPVVPDPVIPDPVIPEPVVPEPVVPEPVVPDPVIPEPVIPEPVIPEPSVIDPVTPVEPVLPAEPISTPEPDVEPVIEPLEPDLPIVEPVVPTPEEAHQILLDTLLEEAQADDVQIPEAIANIPVLGATIVALTDALNFVGNVGADMSPKVRAQAKKEVVAAIVLTQISQFATSQSLASAQSSASAGASGSSSKTRRNKE